MNSFFVFVLINFVVAFISDVILNDLSRNTLIFSSLQPYFKNKLISLAGIYAGITIAIATIILLLLFKVTTNKYLPDNTKNVLLFLGMSYFIGYLLDVIIEKYNIFGYSLKPFYKQFGSGNSGAIAFIFSLAISLFIFNYILL
jgi:hypothetical protein